MFRSLSAGDLNKLIASQLSATEKLTLVIRIRISPICCNGKQFSITTDSNCTVLTLFALFAYFQLWVVNADHIVCAELAAFLTQFEMEMGIARIPHTCHASDT